MKTKLLLALLLISCTFGFSQETLTLGSGTSASATRGPLQRSDSGSSSVYSRATMLYSATELASLTSTAIISQINFDLGSENIITASGDATLKIYMKNSSATEVAAVDTQWDTAVSGATLVGTYTFNTANNFPGTEGFLSFDLDSDFNYSGGALEVSVDWDCSNLIPLDAGQPNQLFSGNGSLNWHWSGTTHASLLYDASSSQPTVLDTRKSERVNTQIVYTDPNADQTLTLGSGTSASATRGPLQRSDSGSSSVYSRATMLYSATELTSLTSDATISMIKFDLGSVNIITASGDATLKVYMKNSSATEVAAVDTAWDTAVSGATLVGTYTFNTTNNFPGAEGFLSFDLDSDFNYSGGALEVSVDWDCSNLVPLDAGDPNLLFSGDGSLNWHWSGTTHASLLYDASSSQPTALDTRKSERVNTELVYKVNTALSTATLSESDFSIYPNPVKDVITIKLNDVNLTSVEMYNVMGQKILSTTSLNNNQLNVSELNSGIYLLNINADGKTLVKKIIKE
ncbi:T9SS type A sorting domain-containing protein [Wenyingzhuangia fucanilytica]|nr:T9SS type A sorting domain-containing protein [Wenyingzhuangia fucanilytica]